MLITNIEWDIDEETEVNLPTCISINKYMHEDDVACYLSDTYGWCVKSFRIVKECDRL